MKYYRCIKDLMDNGIRAFTKGKNYGLEGEIRTGDLIVILNDLNRCHALDTKGIGEFFEEREIQEGGQSPNRMLDSLLCECGGQYEHIDQEENGWDDTVKDSYQCNKCETWCYIIWEKETEKEIKREYGKSNG